MRTTIKVIVASLGLLALQGAAAAEGQDQNRALYHSIAVQGDQALLDIRASVVGSIAPSMNQQMAASLAQLAVADEPNHVQQLDADSDLTAMALGH